MQQYSWRPGEESSQTGEDQSWGWKSAPNTRGRRGAACAFLPAAATLLLPSCWTSLLLPSQWCPQSSQIPAVLVQMPRGKWILSCPYPTLGGNVCWIYTVFSSEPNTAGLHGTNTAVWGPQSWRGITRDFSEFSSGQTLLRTVKAGSMPGPHRGGLCHLVTVLLALWGPSEFCTQYTCHFLFE